jgi:hypothetical protein
VLIDGERTAGWTRVCHRVAQIFWKQSVVRLEMNAGHQQGYVTRFENQRGRLPSEMLTKPALKSMKLRATQPAPLWWVWRYVTSVASLMILRGAVIKVMSLKHHPVKGEVSAAQKVPKRAQGRSLADKVQLCVLRGDFESRAPSPSPRRQMDLLTCADTL